jgi:hypothetical protein
MKRFFIYIFLLGLSLASCNKAYLTRNDPTSTTDDKWWKTQGELDNALAYIYSFLPQGGYAGNPNVRTFYSSMTDDAYWNGNFYGSLNTMAIGDGSSSIGWPCDGVWGNNYKGIRMACRFMKYAGNAYMDPALKQRYIFEARAMRAWYTLELWLYFRNIPLVKDAVTPDESTKMTNSTQEEIADFIISELDTCAANLPVSYTTDQAWRVTKGACLAMKAIFYLNAKDYQKAADAAKVVMELKDENGRPLYQLYHSSDPSANSYSELFSYTGKINQERIFFKPNALNDIWFRNAPTGISPGPQQAALNPTASLVNTYETRQGKTLDEMSPDSARIYETYPYYKNNRDPRLAATILYPGEVFAGDSLQPFTSDLNNPDRIGAPTGSQTGFWDRKYLDMTDRGATESSTLDFMLIRYAQILLIRAEALVESGNWQDPDVIQCLNAIRERAGMPDVDISKYNSQEKLRALYQRERRVELALEGWRWFDIRRWDIGNTVMNGPVYGATNPQTGEKVVVQKRTFTQRDNLWPIPQNEINSSKIVQNLGW